MKILIVKPQERCYNAALLAHCVCLVWFVWCQSNNLLMGLGNKILSPAVYKNEIKVLSVVPQRLVIW